MSDLQDALDLHDEWMTGVSWNPNDPHSQAILVIVEAARKYASPDIEAALLVKVGDPCDMDGKRDQVNEWFTHRDIRAIVDAALGVTE